MQTTIRDDPQQAFEDAIKRGVLSRDRNKSNFVGRYMYMYTDERGDSFKHIDTRQYVLNDFGWR
jgi:hypothetical protein